MSQLDRIRRFYDKDAATYDRAMQSGFTRWMVERGRKQVGKEVRGRVLDVGFGTGLSLPYYPNATEVTGVDLSLPMLRLAPAAAMRVEADAERLPFAERTFDSVAFNLCLCTIPDPAAAVREAVRVARPGAPMLFFEHVRSNLLPVALVQDVINPVCVWLAADHFNRRTADTVRRAGIEITRIDRWLGGIFNLIVGKAPS